MISCLLSLLFSLLQGELLSSRGLKPTVFDSIAGLAHEKFNQVLGTISEALAGRKVMAALIMKRGPGDEGVVISLGTGKCLSICI